MCGRATLTTVASRMSISWATRTRAIPAAARPAWGGSSVGSVIGVGGVGGVERWFDEVMVGEDTVYVLFWRERPT